YVRRAAHHDLLSSPTRRSSDLFSQVKSVADSVESAESTLRDVLSRLRYDMSYYAKNGYTSAFEANQERRVFIITDEAAELADSPDRKSTRLNSSHVSISYAVFC